MTEKRKLSVIIPSYNEAENLKVVLPPLIEFCALNNWEIIIVNDGSKDNSKEILEGFTHEDNFTVIHHKLNKGYGGAIKSGIRACKTEYLITIDADGQHRLEDIENLYHCITSKDADMIVGSRKGIKSASFFRGIGKGLIRMIAKILMTVPIHDINSGMKIYRTDLAQKYLNLTPNTMSFSDIITLCFISNRHFVLEEPIQINPRMTGESTISMETAFQTVMEIINIVVLFNPMKIFLSISIIAFLIGFIVGAKPLFEGHGITMGSVIGIISGVIFFLLGLIAEQLSAIRKNR